MCRPDVPPELFIWLKIQRSTRERNIKMSFKNRMQERGSGFKWRRLKSKNYILWTTQNYWIHVKREISQTNQRQWASQERLLSIKSAIDGNNFADISKKFNPVLIICTFASVISIPFYHISWFSTSSVKKKLWLSRKSCRIWAPNSSVLQQSVFASEQVYFLKAGVTILYKHYILRSRACHKNM